LEKNTIQQERAKWFQARFLYSENDNSILKDNQLIQKAIQKRNLVDKEILEWIGREVLEEESWHIRWGTEKENQKREFLALRVRPQEIRKKNLKSSMSQFGEKLKKERMILDTVFDDESWWKSDDVWPSDCRDIGEWEKLSSILHYLTQIVLELHSFKPARRQFFFYEKVIHHLHNMIHVIDSFRPSDIGITGRYSRALLMTHPMIKIGDGLIELIQDWDAKTSDTEGQ